MERNRLGAEGSSLRAESSWTGGKEGSTLRVEGIRSFGRVEGFSSGID